MFGGTRSSAAAHGTQTQQAEAEQGEAGGFGDRVGDRTLRHRGEAQAAASVKNLTKTIAEEGDAGEEASIVDGADEIGVTKAGVDARVVRPCHGVGRQGGGTAVEGDPQARTERRHAVGIGDDLRTGGVGAAGCPVTDLETESIDWR